MVLFLKVHYLLGLEKLLETVISCRKYTNIM